jgi:group I intron endonuclease
MICGIYLIRNKLNGKCYIGQAHDIEKRWVYYLRSEFTKSCLGIAGAELLRKAIKKHGIINFDFSVLEELPEDDQSKMNSREQFWVSKFHAFVEDGGYNLTLGGGQNGSFSKESRKKMSNSHIGLSHTSGMKGRKHSETTKQKLSENNKGKHSISHGPKTKEQKQRQSEAWTPEMRSAAAERARNQPKTTGWHHSDEIKQKMSDAKKGKPATNKGIPRSGKQKLNDHIIALKRHLSKGKPCLRFTDTKGNVQYFVSEYEAATQLTGKFAPATLIMRMIDNPAYIPAKRSSLGWITLQGCKFETCSQSELLEHREELKLIPQNKSPI